MSSDEQLQYLREQALPKLFEGGMECFALIGYMRKADGELQRVCLAHTGNDPAFEDAMRVVLHFAHVWGSPPPAGSCPAQPPPFQG